MIKEKKWGLRYQNGRLYCQGKKSIWRITAFLFPQVRAMRKLQGCTFDKKEAMSLQGFTLPNKSLRLVIRNLWSGVTHEFNLVDGEVCFLVEEEGIIQKEKMSDDLKEKIVKINPLPGTNRSSLHYSNHERSISGVQIYEMLRDGMFSESFGFWCKKKISSKEGSGRAVALYNDGKHLYVKQQDGQLTHLRFRLHRNSAPCYMIPGFNFPELEVVFKSHGHTLSGSAIVVIRHLRNNWSLHLSITPNTTAKIYDVGHSLRIAFVK